MPTLTHALSAPSLYPAPPYPYAERALMSIGMPDVPALLRKGPRAGCVVTLRTRLQLKQCTDGRGAASVQLKRTNRTDARPRVQSTAVAIRYSASVASAPKQGQLVVKGMQGPKRGSLTRKTAPATRGHADLCARIGRRTLAPTTPDLVAAQ